MRQWGNPFSRKPLQGHVFEYSYYDYIDAWYKILLYQFDDMSHSWFIQWHEKYNFIKLECQLPMWFIKWWDNYDRDKIIKFVFDEFPVKVTKQLENKPSSSSIPDLLKDKSPEELAEICRLAAI